MAEASASILSLLPPTTTILRLEPFPSYVNLLRNPSSSLPFSLKLSSRGHPPHFSPSLGYCSCFRVRPSFELRSTVEEVACTAAAVDVKPQGETLDSNRRRTLYVVNLPYTTTPIEIKNLFSQCGTVKRVNFAKTKDGKNRGYAFVTMGTREEADAAIEKLNSMELSGRIMTVEYVKGANNPLSGASDDSPVVETQNKIYQVYVSNLNWEVRTSHLREFFSTSFKPRSARIIFDNTTGKPAGYGFVSFDSKEEVEAAISSLNGKELMGRQIVLKYGERSSDSLKKEENKDSLDDPGDEHPEQP
ncbi:hypothetical protein Dimus_007873 [Dionaea muscipula]